MTTNHTDSREAFIAWHIAEYDYHPDNIHKELRLRNLAAQREQAWKAAHAQSAKAEPVAGLLHGVFDCRATFQRQGWDKGQMLWFISVDSIEQKRPTAARAFEKWGTYPDKPKGYLTAPQPQACKVPDGMKLVPIEPTDEMKEDGRQALGYLDTRWEDPNIDEVYKAMLAAAPSDSGEVKP